MIEPALPDDDEPSPFTRSGPVSRDVRPFAFGQTGAGRPAARLSGLERMNERLARLLRGAIEGIANARTAVAALPLSTRSYGEWKADLPEFMVLHLYRPRPLKGGMLLALEPAFVAAMVDAFYGGSGIVSPPKGPELSPSEDRLADRIAEVVLGVLREGWADVLPFDPELVGRETVLSYASLVRDEDPVVVQAFEVRAGQARPATIAILYPLATLRPIEDELATKVHSDIGGGGDDGGWRERLAAALEDVRLPVRSVLARPEISVSQLLALKPGDVIPISLQPTVPLIVGQKRLAEGVIGEQEGRAALQIQTIGAPPRKGNAG
ncbi:FliM/FliN family flagellar motor switch protein [Sphingomonas naphthae]|uniref:Flagellar motor switch protein FliM n=1 Tax=Sphingomonas naphthae TaxID=1813468 RepID=A0ABY7TIA3_9SPHN|nr:FliM/FliN family flagellar motor switch protein [Sphingomonas naphthae]WCT72905.1 FliM/FliN family flagellar motor switch protein [Sphingomonas naphthae]